MVLYIFTASGGILQKKINNKKQKTFNVLLLKSILLTVRAPEQILKDHMSLRWQMYVFG